jgi:hypothetical protein
VVYIDPQGPMKADRGSTLQKKFGFNKKGVFTMVKINILTLNQVTRGSTNHKKNNARGSIKHKKNMPKGP